MPLAKLFGNKRKDRGGTTVHQISEPFHLPQDDEQFSQFGPMSSRAKSPSDILDFSGYPRLEPLSNKYGGILPKAIGRNGSPPAPQLAMPKPKHAIPPANQVLMGEERDKTEIEHSGRPVYETSTHLPPRRNSASSGGYMGEREDSPEVVESPENVSAQIHSEQSSPREKSNSSESWNQLPRKPLPSEEGKGFFAAKNRSSITQPTAGHTPPVFAPPTSSMPVKSVVQELRSAPHKPLPLTQDHENMSFEPSRYSKATTLQEALPSPTEDAVTNLAVAGHGANAEDLYDEAALKNTPDLQGSPQSYTELVDLRQQMSAIRLEREEWKKREHEHRQREQEMLDQINQTQAQLQLALSNSGFLAGTTDPRPDTPEEEGETAGTSKPNQLGPASEDGSMSDDREFYSLPPSRSRRERDFSDYGEDYSEYSADEPGRDHRRRSRSHRFEDEDGDIYYEELPSRRSKYYDMKPRLYEPEPERRRRYHSYTPSSVESDLSVDYSPRFSGRYSSRHDDCDCHDCLADREHDLYYGADSPEYVSVRSRSRASSHRSRSRSGSISRGANRSDSRSRNRSRSGSRADSRAGSVSGSRSQSRSQNRSRASSRSQGYNSFHKSTPRRHSQYGPEEYYDEGIYVPHSKHKSRHRKTRSSGSMRKQYRGPPHPGDIPYEDWPEMHEQYMPMPEPHFPIPPPFHGMHPPPPPPHPAMASHMSLPDMGPDPQQAMPPPPPPVPAAQAAGPRPRPPPSEASKEGPRGILRKPSGSLPNMQQRQSQPQHPSQHQPQQHGPFPMQHFGPPMMSPHGPFPPPGMGPHHPMGFPPPPHGMFSPQGPPWHGGPQQPPPMHGPVPPGNSRKSRKS